MENVIDSKEFRKELLYYKFVGCGEELFTSQLGRIFDILYRPTSDKKKLCLKNEEVKIYNNKAMLYDVNDKYKYILNGAKLLGTDTLKRIVEPSENTIIDIFHHNDMDGDASGAIVNLFVSNPCFNNTVYHTSYGYTIDSIIPSCDNATRKRVNGKYCVAFVVDISLSEEQYRRLLDSFDEVIWIDHHTNPITMLNDKTFNMGKSQIIIDTRYSATYLCYNLFKGYLKKYCDINIKDTFPTIVSIEDTKPDDVKTTSESSYLAVKLTPSLRQRIIERQIPYKRNPKSGVIIHSDEYYESVLKSLNTVYIKNAIDHSNTIVKYNKCRFFGMYLNSYYRNMGGMNCYNNNIYEELLTNDEELFKVLETGMKLKEIEFNKTRLISESEAFYSAYYDGECILGYSNVQLPNSGSIKDIAKLIIKRISSSKVKATVITSSAKIKAIGMNKILKDLYGECAQGGHKGISSVNLPVRDINNFFNDLKNGRSYKIKNFDRIIEINKNMKIEINGSKIRKDEMIDKTFKMIAIGLFMVVSNSNQKTIETMING